MEARNRLDGWPEPDVSLDAGRLESAIRYDGQDFVLWMRSGEGVVCVEPGIGSSAEEAADRIEQLGTTCYTWAAERRSDEAVPPRDFPLEDWPEPTKRVHIGAFRARLRHEKSGEVSLLLRVGDAVAAVTIAPAFNEHRGPATVEGVVVERDAARGYVAAVGRLIDVLEHDLSLLRTRAGDPAPLTRRSGPGS